MSRSRSGSIALEMYTTAHLDYFMMEKNRLDTKIENEVNLYNAWIKTAPLNTEADDVYAIFRTKAQQYENEMQNLITHANSYYHRKREAARCIEDLKKILPQVKQLNKNNPLVYYLKEQSWLESEILDQVSRYNAKHKKDSSNTKADEAYELFQIKSQQYEHEMRKLKDKAIEYIKDLRMSVQNVQDLNNPLASWRIKL